MKIPKVKIFKRINTDDLAREMEGWLADAGEIEIEQMNTCYADDYLIVVVLYVQRSSPNRIGR